MKFKDFIYYVMLIVVAGLFLVLAFSYFGKIKVGSGGGLDIVSVDLASGEVNSEDGFFYDIPDFLTYEVIEFYFYSFGGTGFGKIVVSDYIAVGYSNHIRGSLLTNDQYGKIVFVSFIYDLLTLDLSGSLYAFDLGFIPVNIEGYLYIKGVNYV